MFRTFKNLELFRHQVSSRVDKSLREYISETKSGTEQISNTIFSASFSLVIALITQSCFSPDQDKYLKAIVTFLLFALAYIISYKLYKRVLGYIEKTSYNLSHHGTEMTQREIKELIDDFDHIACDNNLIGKEFIRKYKRETDNDLKKFDFYELYYYVKVSADITYRILLNANSCVNTLETSTGVDLHRVYNQLDMLMSAKKVLISCIINKEVSLDTNLMYVVTDKIKKLSDRLDEIKSKCDEFYEQNFSDIQIGTLAKDCEDYLKGFMNE